VFTVNLLEWTFSAKKGGTTVTLRHSSVPATQAASYAQVWQAWCFEPMKAWFAVRSS
jgi:hypothetical protein